MANTQAQFGFKHIGYLGGAGPDYQLSQFMIQSSNTTKIGFGDPIMRMTANSTYIDRATPPASGTGVPTVIGIFQGCQFTPSGGLGIPQWSPFWPGAAAADAIAYVIDAPNAKFLVAALNTSAVTANINQVVNFTSGGPSTVGAGLATATIEMATATSNITATWNPFRIVGLYKGVGNGSDPTTPFGWMEVAFNSTPGRNLAGM